MNKPKRNDPCTCGSGKKYKKCCGSSNVTTISPEVYNSELENFHIKLISFAMQQYESELEELTLRYPQPFIGENEELSKIYMAGLTFWAIPNLPFLKNDQTIFATFYQKQESKMRYTNTKNTFAAWANTVPSIFDILTIDKEAQQAHLRDVLTDENYIIPFTEEDDFKAGNLAIGVTVPYVGYHNFLFTMVELFDKDREKIIAMTKSYTRMEGGLAENFPALLADILVYEDPKFEWPNPAQEKVAELFEKQMQEKGMDEQIISIGVKLWNIYCSKENPTFKKLGSYAAALDYFVQDKFQEEPATQSRLAKEYETTATTVSSNYRKLTKVLDSEWKQLMNKSE
ncbi:YecA family protein [Oceanobacillus sp. FSL W7-1309]|uniref:YecA family protein n=1 Tax=Oceanobacillus sp. FSL W7-1309 TaxID=2954539 RepID=UPI0030FCBFBC